MEYIELLYVFFKIGLLGFGGGYAMLSLIQFEVVDHFSWMTLSEFSDIVAISQMTPGPVSINTATYVGYEVASVPGAVVATLALCFPSVLLMFWCIRFLLKYERNRYVNHIVSSLRPVLGGLILAASIILVNRDTFSDFGAGGLNISVFIFIGSFIALYYFKVNPIWLILVSGLLGAMFM